MSVDSEIITHLSQVFPHLSANVEQLFLLEQQKMWHEITLQLNRLVQDEVVVAERKSLLSLYERFVKRFAKKLDQLQLARFITFVANAFDTNLEKAAFLQKEVSNLSEDNAIYIINLQQISCDLRDESSEANEIKLTELKEKVEKNKNPEPLAFSFLYRVSYEFYLQRKNPELLYQNALSYLAYTQPQEIPLDYQKQISVNMAISILVSPKIYNFSELLQQKVVLSLKDSAYTWLYQMIQTFNRGDVRQFDTDVVTFSAQIAANIELANSKSLLEEKIRIMAFLDLVFNLPKNDRTVQFTKVAERTHQQVNQVEYLLMRVLALKLITGTIDQVTQTVTVKTIIPRVLDKERIEVIQHKLEQWTTGLRSLITQVEKEPIALY